MLVDAGVLSAGLGKAMRDSRHGVKPRTGFAGGVVYTQDSAAVSVRSTATGGGGGEESVDENTES